MYNKLKNYFKNLRQDVDHIKYAQHQLWASQKLQSLFGYGHFIPQTGWSMTPQAILHILNLISLKKPSSIIEFGSGATTLYIAKLLKIEKRDTVFFSVESDMHWKLKMDSQLAAYGLQDYVTIIYAPLEKVESKLAYKNQETWYNTSIISEAISDASQFELVVVDGPFGGSTPFARYSAFPFLEEKTNEDTVWLLDDTNRAEEREILNEWQRQMDCSRRSFRRYSVLLQKEQFDFTPYRME